MSDDDEEDEEEEIKTTANSKDSNPFEDELLQEAKDLQLKKERQQKIEDSKMEEYKDKGEQMANKFATSFKGFFKEAKQKVQEKVKSEEFKQLQEKLKEAKESEFVKKAKSGAQQAAENLSENLATGGEKMEEMLTNIQKNQEAQNQRIGLDTFLKQEEERQLPPLAQEVEAPIQAAPVEMSPENQHFVIDDEQEDEIDLSHQSPVQVEEPQVTPTVADQVMQPFP